MDEITINVVIADRNYTITIERHEEEQIRKAVKDINEKIKNFSSMYGYKDKQDLIAMAALQISTENTVRKEGMDGMTHKTKKEAEAITALIDNYLDK